MTTNHLIHRLIELLEENNQLQRELIELSKISIKVQRNSTLQLSELDKVYEQQNTSKGGDLDGDDQESYNDYF